MAKPILSNLDGNSTSKLVNMADGSADQDYVTFIQLQTAREGIKQKDPVRVSTQGNLVLTAPGAAIDGVTLATGDRFLARSQTLPAENGIYVFNGAATPATRALDANSGAELNGALVPVAEGTDTGLNFRQTATIVTLGTDPVTWSNFGTSVPNSTEVIAGKIRAATQGETDAGTIDLVAVSPLKLATSPFAKRKVNTLIGDGSATQIDVTHNFNTRDVVVEVYRNSGNFDTILCDVGRTSVNAVRLNFVTAPTSNQFKVVVIG